VLVLLLLLGYAVPFFWQLLTSFKPDAYLVRLPPFLPTRLTAVHYEAVIRHSLIPRALGNSLAVAGLTTLAAARTWAAAALAPAAPLAAAGVLSLLFAPLLWGLLQVAAAPSLDSFDAGGALRYDLAP